MVPCCECSDFCIARIIDIIADNVLLGRVVRASAQLPIHGTALRAILSAGPAGQLLVNAASRAASEIRLVLIVSVLHEVSV